MAMIVDANCAGNVLCENPTAAFAPVLKAILEKRARLVIGGLKLREEYMRIGPVWRFLIALDKAGLAIAFPDEMVNAVEDDLKINKNLKSDDPHILALALVSGARLLCSHDKDLHKDFTSIQILPKPRGKVYQDEKHSKLLKACA